MWTLWLFGPSIEDRLGHGRYLAFYLVCGLAASLAHVLFNPVSIVPALGASGAITGTLGCFMRLFPLARIVVIVPILFIPLFVEVYAFVFIGSGSCFSCSSRRWGCCCHPPAETSRGGLMSEDSWRGSRLALSWSGPGNATAPITRTRVCSASIPMGGYERFECHAIGGFHVDG